MRRVLEGLDALAVVGSRQIEFVQDRAKGALDHVMVRRDAKWFEAPADE